MQRDPPPGVTPFHRVPQRAVPGVSLALVLALGAAVLPVTRASPAGVPSVNPVQIENSRPGTSAWRFPQAPGRTIEGYASEVSVAPGQPLHLHVSTTPAARYRVEVFRLGWYGGKGGRLVACLPSCTGDEAGFGEPMPPFDPATGFLDAGWPVTDTLKVGPGWVSGYFLADLVLTSGPSAGSAGWVPFIVRASPSRSSAILVQASVNTWQAYNRWGGMSLYTNPAGASCKGVCTHVSFNRPYESEMKPPYSRFELPLVHFLEEHGYDVSYTTDADTDASPPELLRHRLVITAGHSEYWTKTMRDAFERARALGTNLAFMGANTSYSQMRYADDRRTIVEYRVAALDPEPNPALKTVRFRSLVPPRPECELLGVAYYKDDSTGTESTGGPFDYSVDPGALTDPWFRGTGFTATSTLAGLVGYEWDNITPGCPTPPLTVLFRYQGPPVDADAVRYTAPSGARVFSAGSLNFSHGLDDYQYAAGTPPTGDSRLERFVQNALADLTRPAPPISVLAVVSGSTVSITLRRHPDPRVLGVLVYRGRTLLCASSQLVCTDHRPPRQKLLRYTAVLRDRWGTSLPSVSQPVSVSGAG